ncbi:MAG: hypothetical protein ACI8WT_004168 [Clostridium sp.]|jgi:hypothetical protein
MIIYYPTYYLVPVVPVISIDEDEHSVRHNDEHSVRYNDEYSVRHNDEYSDGYNDEHSAGYYDKYIDRYNMKENEGLSTYRNIIHDIFGEIDAEYVNENTK